MNACIQDLILYHFLNSGTAYTSLPSSYPDNIPPTADPKHRGLKAENMKKAKKKPPSRASGSVSSRPREFPRPRQALMGRFPRRCDRQLHPDDVGETYFIFPRERGGTRVPTAADKWSKINNHCSSIG